MSQPAGRHQPGKLRLRVAQGFTRVEDVLYVGLGLVLAASAAALLVNVAAVFGRSVLGGVGVQGDRAASR